MGLGTLVKHHFQIAKVFLCLLVAFSALFGFFLVTVHSPVHGLLVFFGVLSLAAGAATLNSVQERLTDGGMGRTRHRPLAQGLISRRNGLLQAQLLLGAGFFVLYIGSASVAPVLAGIFSVLLYNFLYTPLKHKTVWAIFPGALCGALPPYIGWLAAGGGAMAPEIISVIALFIVWQIPHFWLVVLDNQQDYRFGDIPSILKMMPAKSLRFVSVVWVLAMVAILNTIAVLIVDVHVPGRVVISFGSFLFFVFYTYQIGFKKRLSYRFLFVSLNLFMLLVMIVLVFGSANGRI